MAVMLGHPEAVCRVARAVRPTRFSSVIIPAPGQSPSAPAVEKKGGFTVTDEVWKPTLQCASCGVALACDPGPDCWCAALPPQPMGEAGAGCLCPDCLLARAARISEPMSAPPTP